ncbi:MAG: phosphoribosylanthranilate isomerase [Bacteroidaceae bacterium]|nr:phosphoribosylanthranilate isomerase [Bacteroidaceae bacterium]
MTPMMIKVCGMRDADNIREVEALGIDLMGFIFWPKSSRNVSKRPAYLPTKCKRVGVFVDEDVETVKRIANDYALDYIQLHGQETPEYLGTLRLVDGFPANLRLIKAFNIATADDLRQTTAYEGLVDYFLFDTKGKSVGGNGAKFDWSVLAAYDGNAPFLLSGGIGPDDAERLHTLRALDGFPIGKCAGIDLNSRFEITPGLKDVAALRRFLSQLSPLSNLSH